MSEGWIKLFRKFTDWEWYTDIPTKCLFIHLLLLANHQPRKWRGQTVNAGELITSIGSLANETALSEQQIRTALKKLESTGEIERKATNKNTVIIIVNYAVYQGLDYAEQQTNNKQITNKQQTNNKQITTNKNIKNERIKECKNIFITPSVDDVRAYCAERQNGIDAEEFVDFYSAKGWMVGKNKMKDWKAAVRNWERSSFRKPTEKKATSYDLSKAKEQAKRKIIYEEN